MVTDASSPTPNETPRDKEAGRVDRPSFGRLARRISAVTTNCLLTAIVLVAGLAFGRQILRWWAADTPHPGAAARSADSLDPLADPGNLHELQFGALPWSLRRQSITGDKRAAVDALRASCREVLQDDRRQSDTSHEAPGEAEIELLAQLAAREPVDREPGKWQLFVLGEAFPMVVGIRPSSGATEPISEKTSASADRHVAIWGLAIPQATGAWTLCTFQRTSDRDGQLTALSGPPIPPGCTKTLSIRVASGESTVSFEGPQGPKSWIEFYRRWFRTHNWEAAQDWRPSGNSWHGRYYSPEKGRAAEEGRTAAVDLHFGPATRDGTAGLILITPAPQR